MEPKYKVTLITQEDLNILLDSYHVIVLGNPYRCIVRCFKEKEKKRVKEKKEKRLKLKTRRKTYQRVK